MGRIFLLLVVMFCSFMSMAQDFSKAEYFFDTDPGAGNGTSIPLASTVSPVTFTTSISTASLSSGFHMLGLRIKQVAEPWSIFESRGFYVSTSTTNSPAMSAAEYFFDNDPGAGNATAIPVTTGDVVNFTITLPTTSLGTGFHFLAIRTKGTDGKWGVFESRGFYISTATTDVPNIVAAEYFFDSDPGAGNGTSIPVTAGSPVNFTVTLPATGLAPGFHFLAIRTKSSNGKWGVFESRGFYVSGSTTDVSNIVAAEYFIDNDPGAGNGLPIPVTAGANVNLTATLPIGSLAKGFHFLSIRTKGSDDKWGVFESRGFYVSEPNIVSDIVALEYFFDTDPGVGNGESLAVVSPSPSINQPFTVPVPNTLPVGQHFLMVRAQDSEGSWSEFVADTFSISTCTPPPPPTTTGTSKCGVGSVTLTASGATGALIYRWYDDPTTLTVAGTGGTFNTPSLTSTKTFYVSLFDPATTCESPRVASIATVTVLPKPAMNLNGTVSFCSGNNIFLTAPAGFTSYLWSDGSTTRQISVSISGDYFVKIGDGTGCFSENSDTLSVSVVPAPAKPVIQVTGNTTLCGIETTVLSGPSGLEYSWSTGATTQDITVSQAGDYSLSVRNSNGCLSPPSDAVTITNVTGDAIITQADNFLLSTPGESYQWFLNGEELTGETSQVLEFDQFEFGVYAVEVTTGSCFSRSADFTYLITAIENDSKNIFSVAPNPVREILNVHNGLSENVSIVLIDAVGKKFLSQDVPEGDHEYNVSSLSSGVYFLIAKTSTQSKVIKLNKL